MFKTAGQGYLGVGVFAAQFIPAELTEQLSVLILHHPTVVARKIRAKTIASWRVKDLAEQAQGGGGLVGEGKREAQKSEELEEEIRVHTQRFMKRVAKMIPGREVGEDESFLLAAWLASPWSESMMLHGSSASTAYLPTANAILYCLTLAFSVEHNLSVGGLVAFDSSGIKVEVKTEELFTLKKFLTAGLAAAAFVGFVGAGRS